MKKMMFVLPLIVVIISALANIVMAAHMSDVGATIHAYEVKTAKLAEHNDEMLQTLASKESLPLLKEWAQAQGFVARGPLVVMTQQTPKIAQANLR